MRLSTRRLAAFAAAAAVSLTLAACGSPAPTPPPTAAPHAGRVDMNPVDPSDLAQGGELRWPLDFIPDSFNAYQSNGASEETDAVVDALMPRTFRTGPDGKLRIDSDYLVSARMTATIPQTITYTIQPNARWSDGTQITWRDFEAQWKALSSGAATSYQAINAVGYGDIASVTQGRDEKQAVVTFKDDFAEWQGLFSPLYPASTMGNQLVFNTGWLKKIPVTAGPFKVQEINALANTVTLARDDAWWGTPAKLDRILFKVVEGPRLGDALAANEIDFYSVGGNAERLARARTIPGVAVRQALGRDHEDLLFNGAPGTPLSDLRLRRAVAEGIDRAALTQRVMSGISPTLKPQGNNLYQSGSAPYRDNSKLLPFDAAKAEADLTALGWVRQGDRRVRGAVPLNLRLVYEAGNPIEEGVAAELKEQLFRIGVTVLPLPMPGPQKNLALQQGQFDLIQVDTEQTNTPLRSALPKFYEPVGADVAQNFGRIYNEQIVDDLADGIGEVNDIQRAIIGDGVDQLIWTVVHTLPLFPLPETYVVKSNLANFGAPGMTELDYAAIGFTS